MVPPIRWMAVSSRKLKSENFSWRRTTYVAFIMSVLYTKNMGSTYAIHLKISKVENGQFLAESDDMPGLVAQGRTISETVEIAQDVARKLIESFIEHGDTLPSSLKPLSEQAEIDITTIPNHPGDIPEGLN